MGKSVAVRTLENNFYKLFYYLNFTLILFLDMNEASLNGKPGIGGLRSFQSVHAHDLAYWDSFSLQIFLMKHIFLIAIHAMQG